MIEFFFVVVFGLPIFLGLVMFWTLVIVAFVDAIKSRRKK